MAPLLTPVARNAQLSVGKPTNPDALVLEAWAQGFMVGSLIVMACITIANMRRGVLLHKLILAELILGMFHGTFIFAHEPAYGWYLSCTAIFLNISWSLHNLIAWIKNKPFLSRKVSLFYIITVALAQGYWVLEIYANFTFFNNINRIFLKTRPFEALFRDPWWIFTTVNLVYNIRVRYDLSLPAIIHSSPRFGVLLASMLLSIVFIIIDICAVTGVFSARTLPDGINPFWKINFVFKCLTDTIILDDFKTALDRLSKVKASQLSSVPQLDGDTDAGSRSWSRSQEEWGKGVGVEGKLRKMSPAGRTEDVRYGTSRREDAEEDAGPLSTVNLAYLPRRLESGHSGR